MIIYEDTRQQAGKHEAKHRWFERHGIELVRKKLDWGDYGRDGSNILIDTKSGLQEVCQNVGRDHDRFTRELDGALRHGYRLVVLIEETKYSTIADVARWMNTTCLRCNYRRSNMCDAKTTRCIKYRARPMQGQTLMKSIMSIGANHGCRFELCNPSKAAARICELLGVTVDE